MNRVLLSCLAFFMLLSKATAKETDMEHLLYQFEQHGQTKTANEFFGALHAAGFTDSLYQYRADATPDVVRLQVWYWAAEWYYDQQLYDKALAYGQKAMACFSGGGNTGPEQEGDLLNLMALIYVRQGDFSEAAKYAKQCNDLDIKAGNPDNIASSLNTLAGIYMSARQPEKAEGYILQAIEYARQVDNPKRMAVLHGMASEVYHHLRQEERALDYATKAYEMERKLERRDKMAIRQAMRAAALIALGRHKEAKAALEDCIPEFKRNGNRHSLGIACNQMGQLLHQDRNDSAAVRYYEEALQIFLDQKDLFNESHSRKGLYDALRQSNPFQAMVHNDRYNELRDSLYDRETGELLSKYAAEYDNYRLEEENAQMHHSQQMHLLMGIMVVAVLLLCGAWVWYWMYRPQQAQLRESARLQEQIEALTRQEPHEDKKTDMPEEHRQFLLHVIDIVNRQILARNVSVDALASELCLSTTQLRSRLMDMAGETPQNYILGIRMQKARQLMQSQPSISIGEVAMRCAYEEKASFSRAFKRYFGMSPSEYQKKGIM